MAQSNKFRITGGTHKGRTLKAPLDMKTRPMQGFLREAIFNILGPDIPGAAVLDMFSGTGSIGLEALSRGASHCAFCDNYRTVLPILKGNIATMGFESRTKIFRINLLNIKEFPESGFEPYDFIFLDPPFAFHDARTRQNLMPLIRLLAEQQFLSTDCTLIFQVRKKQELPGEFGPLTLSDQREYGSVAVAFYTNA